MQAIGNTQPSPPAELHSPNSPPYPSSRIKCLWFRSKQVRFRVPMTPPPEKGSTDAAESPTLQEVKPDAPTTNEVFKFGSASSWRKKQLDKLGVKFDRNLEWNWEEILNQGGEYGAHNQTRSH